MMSLTIPLALAFAGLFGCATMEHTAGSGPVVIPDSAENAIPAGTELEVRVDQEIKAKSPTPQTYQGALTQEIRTQSGKILVPQGAIAELTVLEAKGAGATGTPQLTLGIKSITVNGKRYDVVSKGQHEGDEGLGVNRRTGEYVGGGAAIGTVVGAIAGGGKGAVIGGVLGGAAGAAAQVLTRGDEVNIPAGTVITFRLDQAWQLQPSTAPQNQPVS